MTELGDESLRAARQCLRRLILPIPFGCEEGAAVSLLSSIGRLGVPLEGLAEFLDLRIREWETGDRVPSDLAAIIGGILGTVHSEGATAIRTRYFDLHRIALEDPSGLSHLQSRHLLSHLPLMIMLHSAERMSASQIVRVLRARDSRVACSWEAICRILKAVGIYRELDLAAFKALFSTDASLEEVHFADSTMDECVGSVADLGLALGLSGSMGQHLRTLLPEGDVPLYSTLEMLHYQLMIGEFYDHALTFTYEHKPRGEAMNWLHEQYPDSIKSGKQPFLNIAKGLYRISEDWALARDRPAEAVAMTRLLEDVESLGFPAKREVSEKVRWLIHRYIKRFAGDSRPIPADLPSEQIRMAAWQVTAEPSQTFGILEQRLVDATASALHSPERGWHPSAIGQSVFASNRSSKKFGDCEFLHHGKNRIEAYEAHAGRATRWYLEDHVSTLTATVASRLASLEENFDLPKLGVKIVFVAHEFEASAYRYAEEAGTELEGIPFEFGIQTFSQLLATAEGERLDDALRRHFALALNSSPRTTTPQRVRDKFMELAASRDSQ
jgi:hypothetical protein